MAVTNGQREKLGLLLTDRRLRQVPREIRNRMFKQGLKMERWPLVNRPVSDAIAEIQSYGTREARSVAKELRDHVLANW